MIIERIAKFQICNGTFVDQSTAKTIVVSSTPTCYSNYILFFFMTCISWCIFKVWMHVCVCACVCVCMYVCVYVRSRALALAAFWWHIHFQILTRIDYDIRHRMGIVAKVVLRDLDLLFKVKNWNVDISETVRDGAKKRRNTTFIDFLNANGR